MISKQAIECIKAYVENYFPAEPVQYKDVIIGLTPPKKYFAIFTKDGEELFPRSILTDVPEFIPGLVEAMKLRNEPVIATNWCVFDVVDRATRTQWRTSYVVDVEAIGIGFNSDRTTISNILTSSQFIDFHHEAFKTHVPEGFRYKPKSYYSIDGLAKLPNTKGVEIRAS